jgi:hypothetical protein
VGSAGEVELIFHGKHETGGQLVKLKNYGKRARLNMKYLLCDAEF